MEPTSRPPDEHHQEHRTWRDREQAVHRVVEVCLADAVVGPASWNASIPCSAARPNSWTVSATNAMPAIRREDRHDTAAAIATVANRNGVLTRPARIGPPPADGICRPVRDRCFGDGEQRSDRQQDRSPGPDRRDGRTRLSWVASMMVMAGSFRVGGTLVSLGRALRRCPGHIGPVPRLVPAAALQLSRAEDRTPVPCIAAHLRADCGWDPGA